MSNRDKFSTKRYKLTSEGLMVKMSDMGEEHFYNKVYAHRKRLYGLVADTDTYDSVRYIQITQYTINHYHHHHHHHHHHHTTLPSHFITIALYYHHNHNSL